MGKNEKFQSSLKQACDDIAIDLWHERQRTQVNFSETKLVQKIIFITGDVDFQKSYLCACEMILAFYYDDYVYPEFSEYDFVNIINNMMKSCYLMAQKSDGAEESKISDYLSIKHYNVAFNDSAMEYLELNCGNGNNGETYVIDFMENEYYSM